MPLLYAIPAALQALVTSGQAQLVGAIIKDVSTGQILGHVQQTRGFLQAMAQVGGTAAQGGFAPLGVISAIQNEQIKSTLGQLQQGMALMQNLQFVNLALSGIGIGVSVAGFAMMNMRLNAIERHIGALREDVREIGKMIRETELRRLFGDIRSALKDLDSVATRNDHLALASSLQRQLSTHVSALSDLLREAMLPGKAASLSMEHLDLIWTLSSALRLCEDAEVRALLVSEDLAHARDYASGYQVENLERLRDLNPDSLARLVAASASDLTTSVALRREAARNLDRIADGIGGTVESLGQQAALAQMLIDGGVSGREFVHAASTETDRPFLFVTPGAQPDTPAET
ncbi:hypothetical protein [Salipiger sp.]|uniref:hypothetical protein n=1 Tax=Salipiger sp. TaxID=2078585 RepID=UPI003A977A52